MLELYVDWSVEGRIYWIIYTLFSIVKRRIFVTKFGAWTQNIVHIVNALSNVMALIIHCLKRTNIAEISTNDLYIHIQILY